MMGMTSGAWGSLLEFGMARGAWQCFLELGISG